jgi:hypothetical protein
LGLAVQPYIHESPRKKVDTSFGGSESKAISIPDIAQPIPMSHGFPVECSVDTRNWHPHTVSALAAVFPEALALALDYADL